MRAWKWRAFADLSPHELYSILQLRALVFVAEQACAYNDLDGYDAASLHLFTEDADGRVVAYLRLLPPGVKYAEPSIGRVVTHPDVRGSGLGVELMREGLRRSAADFRGKAVRIGAQTRVEPFYRSLGFVPASAPYDEDGIEHVEMLKDS